MSICISINKTQGKVHRCGLQMGEIYKLPQNPSVCVCVGGVCSNFVTGVKSSNLLKSRCYYVSHIFHRNKMR